MANGKQLWREWFEGPQLDRAVRTRFARRIVGRVLVPMWTALAIALGYAVLVVHPEPGRLTPVLIAFAGFAYVTWLRRQQRWMQAAAALSVTWLATIGVAVLINSVHAAIYQGGFVLLALVVALFGPRWAFGAAGVLVLVGALSITLNHLGWTYPVRLPPTTGRLVLYLGNMFITLMVLGGMQRLLAEALGDAQREHDEALAAREREAASEHAFHAVFDQASAGIVLLDARGEIARLNRRAAQWLGATPPELVGRALYETPRWNLGHKELLVAAVRAAAAGQTTRDELTVVEEHGAQLTYQINVSPFHAGTDEQGRIIVEIVEVSDLVRTRTMLAQAHRLEALGKLSGGVAHDINNMLAAIQAASDLLRHPGDPSRVEMSRGIIQSSVARASALTRQLLAFGRQDRFETVDVDVPRLVLDLGRLFERTLHKNIAIEIDPGDEPAYVRGDPAALENALLNLALNAQDAMPSGGTLRVTTRVIDLDEATSAGFNHEPPPGPSVLIQVSDTGSGMTDGVRERMFEPFFTTKPAGKGTGLGLSAVHGTVRNHHGAIAVRTQDGIGSTLELYFPLAHPVQQVEPAPAEQASGVWLNARVLVADDEPLVRQALVAVLELAGCDVRVVESGEALIEAIASGPRPDVIVTDLMMPGLSGSKLVQTLEATLPGCPLLLITGFAGDDVMDGSSGRSHKLLRKPISEGELIDALRALCPMQATRLDLRARIA